MAEWDEGYVSDVEYSIEFHSAQSPAWLNHVRLIQGYSPVPLDEAFTCCELGCGQGLTSLVMAAANPAGSFFAVDFNPQHIEAAGKLADSAGLENLEFLETRFGDLITPEGPVIPECDFISLHGVYSWVSEENRRAIVEFVRRKLKPGGTVYVSYNCLPGWAAAMPIQRLFIEVAKSREDQWGSNESAQSGVQFARRLREMGGRYFENPFIRKHLDELLDSDPAYLAHEYLNEDWTALYHLDVAGQFANADLVFAGSCNLISNYPQFSLPRNQIEQLRRIQRPDFRESVKDFMLNTRFRRDVFVRGGATVDEEEKTEFMSEFRLVGWTSPEEIQLSRTTAAGEIRGSEGVLRSMAELLADRPHSIGELSADSRLRNVGIRGLFEVATKMISNSDALPFACPNSDPEPAKRLNRRVLALSGEGRNYGALAVPGTGLGVTMGFYRLLILQAVIDENIDDPGRLADLAVKKLEQFGQKLFHKGELVDTKTEGRDLLIERAKTVLNKTLPKLKQLEMI